MRSREIFTGLPHQPQVTVAPAVIEKIGTPQVNHDGLEDLLYGDLAISRDNSLAIDLYAGRVSFQHGYYNLLSPRAAHVNALAVHKKNLLVPAILHESQHMADQLMRPKRAVGFTALRSLVVGGDMLAVEYAAINNPPFTPLYAVTGIAIALGYTWLVDPREKSAYAAAENKEYLERYKDVITFPGSTNE